MDAVLRQSKAVCPFLKKASPATLRSLSTSTRNASPGGGSMSNLQTIARRCPVMGKAMAIQTAKSSLGLSSKLGLGGVAAIGAMRAFTNKAGKARIHTTRPNEARLEETIFGREKGIPLLPSRLPKFEYR
jgi:5-aminolevulinate synthase